MNVLSLFDWISCGRVAIERAGIKVDKYYASEIDKYAIQISKKNYPDIIHIGSITDVMYCDGTIYWPDLSMLHKDANIDLLIGWSPCQDLSIAKAGGMWLSGKKSGLFFEYIRLLREVKPKYFLLENVASMKAADRDEITRIIWVEPIMINSALVSAQNRKRLYWTNIPWVKQPEDKWILLRDILEDIPMDDARWGPVNDKYLTDKSRLSLREKSLAVTASYNKKNQQNYFEKSDWQWVVGVFSIYNQNLQTEKTTTLGTNSHCQTAKTWQIVLGVYQVPRWFNKWWIVNDGTMAPCLTVNSFDQNNKLLVEYVHEYYWRKLTPIECERLQTLPDWYTESVSATQRYKAIGNWWTVDVISHILSYIK